MISDVLVLLKERRLVFVSFLKKPQTSTKIYIVLIIFFVQQLKEMVIALLHESDLVISEDDIEMIVDKTFSDADTKGDGKIDDEEWKQFVAKNPSLIKNMTLPYLK